MSNSSDEVFWESVHLCNLQLERDVVKEMLGRKIRTTTVWCEHGPNRNYDIPENVVKEVMRIEYKKIVKEINEITRRLKCLQQKKKRS